MARLGLSDSMRATVSIEGTEPLYTAAHRRPPRRPLAASPAGATTASSEQQTQPKAAPFGFSNPLRILLGGVLALVLLSTSAKVTGSFARPGRSRNSQNGAQFERLERNIELLGRDTARLQTTAGRFLQSVQEARVAASTRTEVLQAAAKGGFDEQAETQMQEHEQVVRDVLQYYAQQEQKVMETRERLMKMNITLPVQIAVTPMPETWQRDEQKLLEAEDAVEQDDARDGLFDAIEGLLFSAEKTLQLGDSDYQRMSVESNRLMRVEQSTSSYGAFFFYIFVIGASAVYLWNAISDMRKKELLEEKWAWSPVPKVLSRLKTLLNSVVVVEDLRTPENEDGRTYSPEHIEF